MWVSLKTVFFPIIIGIMIWFWRRVHMLSRSPALLEYMLIYLGAAITFLNGVCDHLNFINTKLITIYIYSSAWIFNTHIRYAIYVIIKWYSPGNILRNVVVILVGICRGAHVGMFFIFKFSFNINYQNKNIYRLTTAAKETL